MNPILRSLSILSNTEKEKRLYLTEKNLPKSPPPTRKHILLLNGIISLIREHCMNVNT